MYFFFKSEYNLINAFIYKSILGIFFVTTINFNFYENVQYLPVPTALTILFNPLVKSDSLETIILCATLKSVNVRVISGFTDEPIPTYIIWTLEDFDLELKNDFVDAKVLRLRGLSVINKAMFDDSLGANRKSLDTFLYARTGSKYR